MRERITSKAKSALDDIARASARLSEEIERLETTLDERTGAIQELLPYPLQHVLWQTCRNGSQYGSPERSNEAAEKAHAESLPLVEENQRRIANNKAIYERIMGLIRNSGLKESIRVKKTGRGIGYNTVEAPWVSSIRTLIPMADNWASCLQMFESWKRENAEWRRKLDAEAAAEKRKKDAEEAKIAAEVTRRELLSRYGLGPEADLSDCLDAILGKNKYLRLAHYLQKNRGDWSDGYDYAETGLSGFEVETPTDREIEANISGLIENWDGDGRCFRDCEWSYGAIFGLVEDPQLMADYTKVYEAIGWD